MGTVWWNFLFWTENANLFKKKKTTTENQTEISKEYRLLKEIHASPR